MAFEEGELCRINIHTYTRRPEVGSGGGGFNQLMVLFEERNLGDDLEFVHMGKGSLMRIDSRSGDRERNYLVIFLDHPNLGPFPVHDSYLNAISPLEHLARVADGGERLL